VGGVSGKPRIFCIVAARPNFMKVAPILAEIEKRKTLDAVLVHTGQHYDVNMSDVFFRDLGIREPDVHLGIGSGSHAEQIGKLMMAFEKLCEQDRPDLVLVVGDVNATVACSLVAAKLHIPVAHVEAGLRSGDRRMPEEINRIVTDQLSDLLFTTCRDADENLKREGIAEEKIHFSGNVMVDSLLANLGKTDPDDTVRRVLGEESLKRDFALLTLHRPSNVDERTTLEGWLEALEQIAAKIPIVCPLHPRTAGKLETFGLEERFRAAVNTLEPLGYHDFIALMQRARLVITDSGGLQEEATVLGLPCLTIRENTERPVTVTQGSNHLVGVQPENLVRAADQVLAAAKPAAGKTPELWDGRAAERIVEILTEKLTAGANSA
jgi:UDP-N-acetylglucosamine 2-epimerase (non-hydrolysing)